MKQLLFLCDGALEVCLLGGHHWPIARNVALPTGMWGMEYRIPIIWALNLLEVRAPELCRDRFILQQARQHKRQERTL